MVLYLHQSYKNRIANAFFMFLGQRSILLFYILFSLYIQFSIIVGLKKSILFSNAVPITTKSAPES
jgi:hypothetical protein